MLTEISKSNLTGTQRAGIILIKGWDAVDTENIAYLRRTAGRTKFGLPKYLLIVIDPKPEKFADILQAYTNWDYLRSVVRAWSLDEAIVIANKRLPKLLAKRTQSKREHIPLDDYALEVKQDEEAKLR